MLEHRVKILVDNSVLRDAEIGQFETRQKAIPWGKAECKIGVTTLMRRPLPPVDQQTRRSAILALPTIARLAREYQVQLGTYEELNWERCQGRNRATGTQGDLFVDVDLAFMEPAVSRSFYHQTVSDKHTTSEALIEFCESLLKITPEQAKRTAQRPNVPSFSAQSLREIARFQELCKGAHRGHLTDLFHLWTGERNECAYFLTMETRICNWIRQRHKDQVKCKPIRADELLIEFEIYEPDPMPFD